MTFVISHMAYGSFHFSALHKSAWEFVEQTSFFSASICCCCSRISSCCASSFFCCSLKALMNTTAKLFSFRSSTSPFSLRVIKRGSTSATSSAFKPMSCLESPIQLNVTGLSRLIMSRPPENGRDPVLSWDDENDDVQVVSASAGTPALLALQQRWAGEPSSLNWRI